MTAPLRLRCSALPLAFLCPGSVRPEGLLVDETNDAATTGTAAHEGAVELVKTGRIDWDGVAALAKRHNIDERELRVLLWYATKLWAEVGASYPNASTEQELAYEAPDGSFVLTGHADIIAAPGADEIRIADWKFGRLDLDHSKQLEGYAVLGLVKSGARSATAGVLWVRDQDYEPYSMTAEAVPGWLERLRAEVVDWDGTYRVGSHCEHCHRSHECPARSALVRRDVAAIADNDLVERVEDETALAAMAPEEIVSVLAKANSVQRMAERVRAAIRSRVMRAGDIVGGGKRLTLQHEERRSLETRAAFSVLEAVLTDEEMAEVIDLSLSRAEEIVAKKAPKRKGAAAIRELRAKLDESGAIKVTTVTKLITRRA